MYKNKRYNVFIRQTLCAILMTFLALSFHSNKIFALELPVSMTVKQKVTVNHEYSTPNDRLKYVIEPITPDAPLPQSAHEQFVFYLTGNEERFIHLPIKKAGEYYYRVYQKDNESIDYLTPDQEVYEWRITVTGSGTHLEVKEMMLVNSEHYKVESTNFYPTYHIPKKIAHKHLGFLPQTGEIEMGNILIGVSFVFLGYLMFLLKKRNKEDLEPINGDETHLKIDSKE